MEDDESRANQKSKPYVVPYREEWRKKFPWLTKDGELKKCIVCNTNITGGIYHLKSHALREVHLKNINYAKTTPKIDQFIPKVTKCPINESAKNFEVMLSAFVAEHNLPFSVMDHINNVIKERITDSQIVKKFKINRLKVQKILTTSIGPENVSNISKFCKQNYYSLVIDESTDCGVSKNLAIVIRIFDGQCRDRFLGLTAIEDCTANGIFEATIKMLEEASIPTSNMIGITTDNCAVMMGTANGVQAKLKAILPHLVTNGCICHILNLVSCAASKFDIPAEIDKFMKDLSFYFCNSSSRRTDFMKFQEYFGTEVHVIFKYSTTRWPSRQEVVERVLEQREPIQYYFTLNEYEADVKNERVKFHSSALLDPIYNMHLLFLQYVLKIINVVNLEMQSEDARMHILLSLLTYLFRQICRNFLDKNVLDNCAISSVNLNENHIPIEEVFCGTEVDIYTSTKNIDKETVKKFKENAKKFYLKFCETLRAKVDFDNEMFVWFNKFSPENVVSGKTNSIIELLIKMFPKERDKFESINSQFRALADTEELKPLRDKK